MAIGLLNTYSPPGHAMAIAVAIDGMRCCTLDRGVAEVLHVGSRCWLIHRWPARRFAKRSSAGPFRAKRSEAEVMLDGRHARWPSSRGRRPMMAIEHDGHRA